jgi:hypothetical protein
MSIAQLPYIQNVSMNDVSLGSNGQVDPTGSVSNIYMSNDFIPSQPGVPYATWQTGVVNGTDPNLPSALACEVSTNSPTVSPNILGYAILPTGGSPIGSGSIFEVGGDLVCNGTVEIPDLAGSGSFTPIGVDSNGKIVDGSTQGFAGKTSPSIVVGSGIFKVITDDSWINYNLANGISTIYLNLNGKVNATTGFNQNLFAIQNSGTPAIPQINANYVDGAPTSNFITMYGYLNNSTNPANSIAGLAYLIQGTSAITVYMAPSINFSNDDQIQFIGTVSYPIESLV